MKNKYKILAAIGAFFGMLMLVFRSSSSSDVTNVKLDENKKKLDALKDAVVGVEEEKKATKKKISKTKTDIKKTKSKKTSTESAVKKAKSFKEKYKS
jgi:predicted  nucleic acid-binding Zn-ribbon protein